MSDADGCIDMQRMIQMLGGAAAVKTRLLEYEEQGFLRPELRDVPLQTPFAFKLAKFDASNLLGGGSSGGRSAGSRAFDSFYESLRSGNLLSPKTEAKPKTYQAKFYSNADARAIAPFAQDIDHIL